MTFGGIQATVQSVSPTRIRGLIPANPAATAAPVDVVVQSGGVTSTLTGAFRYLHAHAQGTGMWETGIPLNAPLADAAAGMVRGVTYVLGDAHSDTHAYDGASGTWLSGLATRPHVGSHHAVVAYGDKLYVLGGAGSESRLQIYDPWTDSWSLGTDLPFPTEAAGAVALDDKIYLLGGLSGGAPTDQAAAYDPATDSWQTLTLMPGMRSHAACSTDGTRIFAFGGFSAVGTPDVPSAEIFAYDPVAGTWEASFDVGATIAPMPQPTADAGVAVYWAGELYVVGGRTGDGVNPTSVTAAVHAFDLATGTWRAEADLPTARAAAGLLMRDGWLQAIGGELDDTTAVSTVERFTR